MGYSIRVIKGHNVGSLIPLGKMASSEGYSFVNRTVTEFRNGQNDFSGPGEILYGIFDDHDCIGICGLNIDPYTEIKRVGRLRHLYVAPAFRKLGAGESLVSRIIDDASAAFDVLRLKSTPAAMDFYDKMGFERSKGEHESHRMYIGKDS